MIEAVNLSKNFDGVQALDDVSFHVEKGEILGFLGPNGAGKTTTMRILTCYFPPTGGTARIAGFDVMEQSLEVRKRIGYLPENVPLYPEMPVTSYLDFVADVKGLRGAHKRARVEESMRDCDLMDVKDRAVGKLSKGFRQRVGLAQALVGNPEVLILDEPTVGLDPRQIIEIRNLIKGLAQKSTVILSTHILQEVSALCSRVIIINKGKILAIDTPENLNSQLGKTTRVDVEVEGPTADVLGTIKKISGVERVEVETGEGARESFQVFVKRGQDVRRELAQKIVEAKWGLTMLKQHDLSLEEIFIQMVTDDVVQAAPEENPEPVGAGKSGGKKAPSK